MSTYFIHDKQGELVGCIEAIDDRSAQAIVKALHGDDDVSLSNQPKRDWYMRREEMHDGTDAISFS